jgi:hypothetical protein
VSKVTGNFGITAGVTAGEPSEPLVDIIALRTMIFVRTKPVVLHRTDTEELNRRKALFPGSSLRLNYAIQQPS